jgi:hypothetical protein
MSKDEQKCSWYAEREGEGFGAHLYSSKFHYFLGIEDEFVGVLTG